MADVRETLAEINATLHNIEKVVDVANLAKEIEQLEEQAAAPDLWNDQEHAQQVTSQLERIPPVVGAVIVAAGELGSGVAGKAHDDAGKGHE